MKLNPPLLQGTLIKRYKRFLADIKMNDGQEITIHCPNTGSMKNCCEPDSAVWFSDSNNTKRKYRYTWELVQVDDNAIAGINTGRANKLVKEAIENGCIPELQGYSKLQTEVKYGEENSRIDMLLHFGDDASEKQLCYVEVKSVTLGRNGIGYFPDAVTVRGQKHIRELMKMVEQGHRAVLFFCVQHTGVMSVKPADDIDPKYGKILREAAQKGVEIMAWQCALSKTEMRIEKELYVDLT